MLFIKHMVQVVTDVSGGKVIQRPQAIKISSGLTIVDNKITIDSVTATPQSLYIKKGQKVSGITIKEPVYVTNNPEKNGDKLTIQLNKHVSGTQFTFGDKETLLFNRGLQYIRRYYQNYGERL